MWQRQVSRGGVYSIAFSPDSTTVYTGDGSGWVSAWDRLEGKQQKLFQLKGRNGSDIRRLAVTPDQKRFLAGTANSFAVWDADARDFWQTRPPLAHSDKFSLAHDGRTLAAVRETKLGRSPQNTTEVFFSDLETRALLPGVPTLHFPYGSRPADLCFSPTANVLAIVDLEGWLNLATSGDARVTPINTDDPDQLIGYNDVYRNLTFSGDGKTLAACSGSSILLWDIPERRFLGHFTTGRSYVRQMAFHPNGKLLASAGDTPIISFWDVPTGKEVQRFDWGIGNKVQSLAFAPDGMTAAAGGSNRTFIVWDLET